MDIPKTSEFGYKLKKVIKRLKVLDGWYETNELVFDPTSKDMERRLNYFRRLQSEKGFVVRG